MSVITKWRNRIAPSLFYTVTQLDPSSNTYVPYPIGAQVVKFYMQELGGAVKIDGEAAVVINPAATLPTDADAGVVRYDWRPQDVDTSNEYVGWFSVELPSGNFQDTPPFRIVVRDQVAAFAGAYTTVAKLKDFTNLPSLKDADDEWLAESVLPRAEAYLLGAFGPFKDPACPLLPIAANMIAEWIFTRQEVLRRTTGGAFKSESMGDYSYTLADMAKPADSQFQEMLDQVAMIIGPCRNLAASAPVSGGSTLVFDQPVIQAINVSTGEITKHYNAYLEPLVRQWVRELDHVMVRIHLGHNPWEGWGQ